MDQRPHGADVEWLDSGDQPEHVEAEHVGRAARWRLPLLLVIGIASLLAAPWLFGGGSDEGDDTVLDRPLSETDQDPQAMLDGGAAESDPNTAGMAINAMQGHVVAELRGLAALDLAFRAVVTSADSDDARLVSVSNSGDVRVAPLPPSSRFRFDASGAWLAGLSPGSDPDATSDQILWVGRVGNKPEPVAFGVDGFAWHDSAAGLIAWTGRADGTLTSLALAEPDDVPTVRKPGVPGDVVGWGDWGFALVSSGAEVTTAVLDPTGALIDPVLSGRLSGRLPSGELLLSEGRDGPVAVDPASGRVRALPWLGADQAIWSAAMSDSPVETILAIARDGRSDDSGGEITLVANDGASVVARIETMTDVAWSIARGAVVFADHTGPELEAGGRIRLIDRDGIVDAALIPDLFRGREWVAALSVR